MNNKKTFHEVSEIWCDAKRPIVKHSTLCAYQLTLQTHLLPRFGAAENITEKDVQQFVIDKCTSGLARKTVRDIVAFSLFSIFSFFSTFKDLHWFSFFTDL